VGARSVTYSLRGLVRLPDPLRGTTARRGRPVRGPERPRTPPEFALVPCCQSALSGREADSYWPPGGRLNRRKVAQATVTTPTNKSSDPQARCAVVGPPFARVMTVTPKSKIPTPATISDGAVLRRNSASDCFVGGLMPACWRARRWRTVFHPLSPQATTIHVMTTGHHCLGNTNIPRTRSAP
jgi:hypothetical protein